jgi:hypothetical protein
MKLQTVTQSPQALSEVVERFVRSRTGGMIRGLRVSVIDRDVILTGRTTTYYNKQLATHAALDALEEDTVLTNEIEVC